MRLFEWPVFAAHPFEAPNQSKITRHNFWTFSDSPPPLHNTSITFLGDSQFFPKKKFLSRISDANCLLGMELKNKILSYQLSNFTLTISRYTIWDIERLKG